MPSTNDLVHDDSKRVDVTLHVGNIILLSKLFIGHVTQSSFPLDAVLEVLGGDRQSEIADFIDIVMN